MTDPVAVDITGSNFQIPEGSGSSLYATLVNPQIAALTEGASSVTGNGAFDNLMAAVNAQLKAQFEAGRITGSEYTKAFVEMTQMAMQTAVQWALQADNSFWSNQTAQIGAITARIGMEKARYEYLAAQFNVDTILPLQSAGLTLDNAGKTLANTGQSIQNDTLTYNLGTVLPGQVALTASQKIGQDDQNAISAYQLSTVLPGQVALTTSQKTLVDAQVSTTNYTLANILPEQKNLVHEQMEVQHAQTSEVRLDNAQTVTGLIGKQKALYGQQIISYQRDAEVKAAKLFTDSWITQKTIDEGLLPPTGFTNTSLDQVLTLIKTNNGFV